LQLEFLLTQRPLAPWGIDFQKEFLPPESIAGNLHYRILAKSPEGSLTFWIDQKSFLIKRVEYSREFLIPDILNSSDIADVSLVAEFTDARANEEIGANLFTLEVPADAKLVRFFVPPPPGRRAGHAAGNRRKNRHFGLVQRLPRLRASAEVTTKNSRHDGARRPGGGLCDLHRAQHR
jgi:hypothetical protein